jgi:hypothetical protein
MFNTIKDFIRKVVNKLFNKSEVEKAMNVNLAISTEDYNFIQDCIDLYQNKAPWVDNKTIFSMNLAAGIASKFAKLVTIEFKSEISNNDFLNKEYQRNVIDKIRIITELACAGGGVVLKPYPTNDKHIAVDVVQANMVWPVNFDSSGNMTAAIFPEYKQLGKIFILE